MSEKKRILAWVDFPLTGTGFANVSRYVLTALYRDGNYDIEQIAINYHGQFFNKDECPWQVTPARLADPGEPYGKGMFLQALSERDYDFVWICNDTYVVHDVSAKMREIIEKKKSEGKKAPVVVYYYPVDATIIPEWSGMLQMSDVIVAYNEHGRFETLRKMPHLESKLNIIYHGVDTDLYRPLPPDQVKQLRKLHFHIEDDNKFLVINVNRNSARKQMARTILAFHEFRKKVPNSMLYLHTAAQDMQIDLLHAVRDLGLSIKRDVIFPVGYSAGAPIPSEQLNEIYNCADCSLTTTTGEGWGLSTSESMAAGVPIVAPDHTSLSILLGNNERGYLYKCREKIWLDNSCYRPYGLIEDIVPKLELVRKSGPKYENPRVIAAREWAKQHTWAHVCHQWLDLFKDIEKNLDKYRENNKDTSVGEVL